MSKMVRWQLDVGDAGEYILHGVVRSVAAVGDNVVEFWSEHDEERRGHNWKMLVVGTGHYIPDGYGWLGTTLRTPSGFVWHLFGKRES